MKVVKWARFLGRFGFQSDTMLLALMVWLCSLPVVTIFVVPLLGLKAAISVAVGLMVFVLIVCWGICWWPKK